MNQLPSQLLIVKNKTRKPQCSRWPGVHCLVLQSNQCYFTVFTSVEASWLRLILGDVYFTVESCRSCLSTTLNWGSHWSGGELPPAYWLPSPYL